MPDQPSTTGVRVELLTWRPAGAPPDDETTVLMSHAPDESSEPVWPGYLSPDNDRWRSSEGQPMPEPGHWAHMPLGMGTGQPQTARDNLMKVACELVAHASAVGLVLTIEQRSVPPLAMGRHQTLVSVREVR